MPYIPEILVLVTEGKQYPFLSQFTADYGGKAVLRTVSSVEKLLIQAQANPGSVLLHAADIGDFRSFVARLQEKDIRTPVAVLHSENSDEVANLPTLAENIALFTENNTNEEIWQFLTAAARAEREEKGEGITSSRKASIRQALEGSLLIEAIQLFALVCNIDNEISTTEKNYIKNYFRELYDNDVAEVLFEEFLLEVQSGRSKQSITKAFKERFALQERIFLVMKSYEIIASDSTTESELKIIREIAQELGIHDDDSRWIESLYQVEGAPPIQRGGTTGGIISWLSVVGNPNEGDIFARWLVRSAYLIKIQDNLFVFVPHGGSLAIVGSDIASFGAITPIRYPNSVFIERLLLHYTDIEAFFAHSELESSDLTLFFVEKGSHLSIEKEYCRESIFSLKYSGLHVALQSVSPDVQLLLNEQPATEGQYLSFNDVLTFGSIEIPIRKIYYENRFGRNVFRLSPHKDEYAISNKEGSDIFLPDSIGRDWQIIIKKKNDGYYLDTSNCHLAVYLNKAKVAREKKIEEGDTLLVRNFALTLNLKAGECFSTVITFRTFVAQRLEYVFADGTRGLEEVSFDVQGGELVAIIGPSGCGKSTLLNILNGNNIPHNGSVNINDSNLHEEFAQLRDYLGYVPQDDLLLEHLTVYENLYYNAKLRFPNRSKEALHELVERVLRDIDLVEKKNMRVGSPLQKTLSGGQRKRLNIGLELLSEAEVFLLDEPTSGLSSKDSERIVELLDRIALRGKMVFVVIHQPGVKLYHTFRKVLLLDKGGVVAFFGGTEEALAYFHSHPDFPQPDEVVNQQLVQPSILLEKIEETIFDLDGKPLTKRLYPPEYWQNRYQEYRKRTTEKKLHSEEILPSFPPRNMSTLMQIKRTWTLLRRNALNKVRDTSNLLITFLEAPGLAFIVAMLFRYAPDGLEYSLYENKHFPDFLFLSIVIMLFLSLTGSVDEIIKDGSLLLRERMMNIKNRSYFLAKLTTLIGFAAIQTFLYMGVSYLVLDLKELFWEMSFFLFIVSCVGIGIGLFVSAIPRLSSKAASNIVPLLLVPQIIFGGSLIPFDDMDHLKRDKEAHIPEFCDFIPSRWAFEGLLALHHRGNSYFSEAEHQRNFLISQKEERDSLIAEWGEDGYEKHIFALEDKLEDFQNRKMLPYGNDRTATLMDEKTFLSSKKIGEEKEVSTPWYNASVLLLLGLLTNVGTLILLRFRRNIESFATAAGNALNSLKKR